MFENVEAENIIKSHANYRINERIVFHLETLIIVY